MPICLKIIELNAFKFSDAELAVRAASRDRRVQRANGHLRQPQASVNPGVNVFTNISQLPPAGLQQMESHQWSQPHNASSFAILTQPETPTHSREHGSFPVGPSSIGEGIHSFPSADLHLFITTLDMDDFIADMELWNDSNEPSGAGLTDGEAALGGEDPFEMPSFPSGTSPVCTI